MRPAFLLTGVLITVATGICAEETTNVIQNGNNTASVTQSGNPADTQIQVERRPGYTRMYQRNGGNSSVIIQSGNPSVAVPSAPDTVPGPAQPDATPPISPPDVAGQIRERASPDSQQMMDRLFRAMGLPVPK